MITPADTNGKDLYCNVKAVFDWLNSGAQKYVTAVDTNNIFTTVANKTLSLLTTAVPFVLSSGSYGLVDATSYQGILAEIFEDLDLDLVVPIVDDYLTYNITSSADSIFSYVYDHCKYMSELGSDERIGLIGYQFAATDGDADTLISTLISKAASFNTPYIVICSPRLKTITVSGELATLNGTYTAATIAGLVSSYSVGEPITNKVLTNVYDVSTSFKNRQIIQLIDNGVLCIEKLANGTYKVVQGVTSWISDDNFNKKEISVRLATNYVAKNCREALKQFIGRKNSAYMLQTIKGALIQVLKGLESEEVIVGTDSYPSYRNLVISSTGDIVNVSFECSPVLPINYIGITISATVFSATV